YTESAPDSIDATATQPGVPLEEAARRTRPARRDPCPCPRGWFACHDRGPGQGRRHIHGARAGLVTRNHAAALGVCRWTGGWQDSFPAVASGAHRRAWRLHVPAGVAPEGRVDAARVPGRSTPGTGHGGLGWPRWPRREEPALLEHLRRPGMPE